MGARTRVTYEGTLYWTHGTKKTHHPKCASCVVEKLLSLITFFAAAKKVIPPPGRRLLNKKQKSSNKHQREPKRSLKKT
jgi:hypothetical protein